MNLKPKFPFNVTRNIFHSMCYFFGMDFHVDLVLVCRLHAVASTCNRSMEQT